MLQTIDSAFRPGQFGVGVNDQIPASSSPGPVWTLGATQIDSVQWSQPPNQSWSLLSVSVSARLGIWKPFPCFGKLGKILAGIAPGAVQTGQGPSNTGVLSFEGFPTNQAGIGTLWDPAVDGLPEDSFSNPIANCLPVTMTVNFPQPVPISPGTPLGIGIWLEPNLIGINQIVGSGNIWALQVGSANYSIIYDDGITPPNYA